MKRAIIFGATGGIGQAIAKRLAQSGWSLYLHCNSHWAEAAELGEELASLYPDQDFMPIQQDFCAADADLKKFVEGLLPVNAAILPKGSPTMTS